MAAKALSFVVGDYVVYPKHGVGRVVELQSQEIAMILWGNLDISLPGAVKLNDRLMGPRRARATKRSSCGAASWQ